MKAKSIVSELYEDDLYSLSEIFHENTKLRPSQMRTMAARVVRISRDPMMHRALTQSYKQYPNLDRVALPPAQLEGGRSLESAILHRRSTREFEQARPVDLTEISKLLHFSAGITGEQDLGGGVKHHLRAAPSGGGLYPIEIYPCLLNVEGAPAGIYHYNVRQHSLELLRELDKTGAAAVEAPFGIHTPLSNPAAIFIFSAIFRRTTFKYSHRGYRLVLVEAGHIAENCWLTAASMGLGAVALFSFLDDEVNALLGLDGVNEAVVYAMAVGHPAKNALGLKEGADV
jgi:SagB-type dehydrogenase family enzyme